MELNNTDNWAFPMAPNTERGYPTHLTASPDGKWFAYGSQNNVVIRQEEVLLSALVFHRIFSLVLKSLESIPRESQLCNLPQKEAK